MEIELCRSVEILSRSLNVLVAPETIAASALRELLREHRYLLLYICGNYSRLLSMLGMRNANFEIRRAFTAAQLLSIVEEAHQTLVFIEHDPGLFAESEELLEYAVFALKELSRESAVTIYSPFMDDSLRSFSNAADRIFCLTDLSTRNTPESGIARLDRRGKGNVLPKEGVQSTLEVF